MLKLNVEIVNFTRQKISNVIIKQAIFETLRILKVKKPVRISLVLVGECRIKNINRDFRDKNKITDVLSFSFFEKPSFKKTVNIFKTWGEIIICPSLVKKQAKKKKINFQNELALLSSHGTIHLFGIDHERSEKESLITDKIQKKVLTKMFNK